jgi:hypothetical protein
MRAIPDNWTRANSVHEHFASRQTRTPVLKYGLNLSPFFLTGSCNVLASSRSIDAPIPRQELLNLSRPRSLITDANICIEWSTHVEEMDFSDLRVVARFDRNFTGPSAGFA